MNIVYATDDNYAFLAGVSIESLFINNKSSEQIDVYLLDDGISQVNRSKLQQIANKYGRNIFFLDVRSASDDIKKLASARANYEGKMSFTAFARLFIDEVLPREVKKALYIDCDTLVVSDLQGAFNTIMPDDCVIAMAVDCTQREYIKSLGINSDRNYYNSGVTLFDVEKWRDQKCGQEIVTHMQNVRSNYPLVDQDLLNVVLGDRIAKLPLKYNVQTPNFMYSTYSSICNAYGLDEEHYYNRKCWGEAMNTPAIIHFSGTSFIRPWYFNSNHPMKSLYIEYYKNSVFFSDKFYAENIFKASNTIKIRYLMFKVLPAYFNGVISGFILKRWIRKQYIGDNAVWNKQNNIVCKN